MRAAHPGDRGERGVDLLRVRGAVGHETDRAAGHQGVGQGIANSGVRRRSARGASWARDRGSGRGRRRRARRQEGPDEVQAGRHTSRRFSAPTAAPPRAARSARAACGCTRFRANRRPSARAPCRGGSRPLPGRSRRRAASSAGERRANAAAETPVLPRRLVRPDGLHPAVIPRGPLARSGMRSHARSPANHHKQARVEIRRGAAGGLGSFDPPARPAAPHVFKISAVVPATRRASRAEPDPCDETTFRRPVGRSREAPARLGCGLGTSRRPP